MSHHTGFMSNLLLKFLVLMQSLIITAGSLSCPPLLEVDNGLINLSNGLWVGSVAEFSCDEGFELAGVSSMECVLNEDEQLAHWNGEQPRCLGRIERLEAQMAEMKNEISNLKTQLSQDIAFTARMNTGYYNPSTYGAIPFSDVIMNRGSAYDNSTSMFTCPIDGLYYFSVSLYSADLRKNSVGDKSYAYLHHDGTGADGRVCDLYSSTYDPVYGLAAQSSTSAVVHCMQGEKVYIGVGLGNLGITSNQFWGMSTAPTSSFTGVLIRTT